MATISPAACDTRPQDRSVSLWYPAGRLGHRDKSVKWLAAYFEALIEFEGFPPPLPLYLVGRGRVAGICTQTRWIRDTIDAWFDGQPAACLPSHIAERAGEALEHRHAAMLDSRAAALGGGRA